MYGSMILSSVVVEKSTKTMELLVTAVKPNTLLFGKVLGTGLVGLSQFAVIMLVNLVSLNFNLSSWASFAPSVSDIIKFALSSNLLGYLPVFFLLGFFIYAFAYAGLGSTVSRMEEANSVVVLPMILLVGAFIISMMGLFTPNAPHIIVFSYIPFFSPMVMYMRMCVSEVGAFEIAAAITVNLVSVALMGVLSARIYKVGVMLYGNPPKLKRIIKYMIKG
jgi:ABC-2 type transport system permease protein